MSEQVFPGLYRGIVVDNRDPERRGRVVVRVPSINGNGDLDWAMPCFAVGATPTVPALGAALWISFEHGDVDHPVWLGTWRVT